MANSVLNTKNVSSIVVAGYSTFLINLDLTSLIAARGIHLSVIAARKLPFFCRLFKSSGGDFDQVSAPPLH